MNSTFFQQPIRSGRLLLSQMGFILLSIGVLSSCSEGSSKSVSGEDAVTVPVLELTRKSIDVPQTYVSDIQAVQFVEIRA